MHYKECNAVSIRFEEMLEILSGKEKTINELKEQFKLDVSSSVGIHAQHDQCNLPEVFLTQKIIAFMASVGADVGFDMYYD